MIGARDVEAIDGRRRITAVVAVFALVFTALAGRAVQLSMSGEAPARMRAPAAASVSSGGRRADIVDRNGEILTTTLDFFSLYVDPRQIMNPHETANALAEVFPDIDAGLLGDRLEASPHRVRVRRRVTPRDRQAVFAQGLAGMVFEVEPRRVYPRGRLAAHVLGLATADGEGASGAELAFDAALAEDGAEGPVALSIDMAAQFVLDDELRAAMELYDARAAVGLIMDVRTGEILAMVSLPDFDPAAPGDPEDPERLNLAVAGVFELGSIFKTFTVAMALEEGIARLDDALPTATPLVLPGLTLSERNGENLSVAQVFVRSSNIGAALLALAVEEESQRAFLTRLGLLGRAPVELVESAPPLVPERWGRTTRATIAYGHGVSVSPVAFLAAFSAIVNGGEYVAPTLRRVDDPASVWRERVISVETSAAMVRLLRLVVERGTGMRADVPSFNVAGKTGTAEIASEGGYDHDRVVSSFAAVFPYDDPQYALLITLDEPHGLPEDGGRAGAGYTAAPVARGVIARAAPILGVARRDDPLMTALREQDR